MDAESNIVYIIQKDESSQPGRKEIILNDELSIIANKDDRYDAYRRLSDIDIETDLSIPALDILWYDLFYFNEYTTEIPGLSGLILLAQRIEHQLEAIDPETVVVCQTVKPTYQHIVADIVQTSSPESELEFKAGYQRDSTRDRLGRLVRTLPGSIFMIVDQLVSFVLTLHYGLPDAAEHIVFPGPDRFQTTKSVLDELKGQSQVVLWRSSILQDIGDPELSEYDPIVANRFVTLDTVLQELRLYLVALPMELFLRKTFENDMTREIEAEFGVELERTIGHAVSKSLSVMCPKVFSYLVSQKIPDKLGARTMTVSVGKGPIGQSIFAAGGEVGAENYYLPHTIASDFPQIPNFETVKISPSQLEIDHLIRHNIVEDPSRFRPLGRPYFTDLLSGTAESEPVVEPMKILITPGKADDGSKLVTAVMEHCESAPIEHKVVVKHHPSESAEKYESLKKTHGWEYEVASSNLEQHLSSADIVFTIDSNVGLEAMLLGTACVSINFWRYRRYPMLYIIYGPVPVLESDAEVETFFSTLDRNRLRELQISQHEFATENYETGDEIPKRIAREIEGQSDDSESYL